MNIKGAPGYPRSCIDIERRRFTGGGVSSSIALALELVELTGGRWLMERAQLNIQYAPDPPVRAGNPTEAPPEVTKAVLEDQHASFIEPIGRIVQKLLKSL
jgi:transcriptional regulator GlxA family with amidase domain